MKLLLVRRTCTDRLWFEGPDGSQTLARNPELPGSFVPVMAFSVLLRLRIGEMPYMCIHFGFMIKIEESLHHVERGVQQRFRNAMAAQIEEARRGTGVVDFLCDLLSSFQRDVDLRDVDDRDKGGAPLRFGAVDDFPVRWNSSRMEEDILHTTPVSQTYSTIRCQQHKNAEPLEGTRDL